ncbi:cupin-like domain-containing protein [Orrella sp. NBD-18]|uniref:Cupin-like domain-containing protein n=1 Tax=Sheuella amnicola TaxID=2707330 RepID=A0A6B2QXW4_9BURK|nr:cupin-like domain-containing protein [Sheuella amnicola]NDY82144.1 cupin-like domain-containing protein [Sheuella amnicola]HBI82523.1 hypothetical protein [Alcaligenaceae bacterium]
MINEAAINLYPNQIPQMKLKEFVDKKIDIYEFCSKNKKPLLITNVYEVFPELAQWSPEFLREKAGNKVIEVNTSKTDVFQEYHQPIKMTLDEYAREISLDTPTSGRRLYMGAQGVNQSFPEIKSDIHFDQMLPSEKLGLKYLWYGPGGNTTGLHYDTMDNFFMQLYGQKRWILSEPDSFLNLYPRSAFSHYPRVTDFNPLRPDFEKFPRARKVKFYDVTINPGNILYAPPYWWHQVISYSTIISVNIWCATSKLKAEWGALQLIPTYIKGILGHSIFPKQY